MRASTRKRIEALEATVIRSGDTVPIIMIELFERGDPCDPVFTEHDGHRWTQEEGETIDAFKERAQAAALKVFKRTGPNDVLPLVFQRPRLTLEKWRAKHGLAPPPDDLLAGLGGAAG